ncbi:glycosyltransferase [Mycolicibacterium palauense]|uniref:glycosyltransferase n=1 Tax=Mycolicibacterium palauense TaxID=2034511 RepID=UPI001FE8507D|nr:glycosyltransferase [Mycolicibacterium palauense]
MTDPLNSALRRASSRLAPPPTPVASALIHTTVLVLWISLFLLVFGHGGIFAWSVGLAYLAYDAGLQIFTAWRISRIVDATPGSTPEPTRLAAPTTIAVLIAAHNEVTALPVTLTGLLRQHSPPETIYIADDGSTDGTAEMLRDRYGLDEGAVRVENTTLRLVRLPHGGKAKALNAALLLATEDVIITIDADTVVDPAAVAAVRREFAAEPELVGITGVITPVCAPTRTGRVMQWFQTYEYIQNFLARHAWMQLDCLQLISGAFAGFRRQAVVDVGGFDGTCLVEDYELVARMQRYAGDHGLRWRFRVVGDAQARTEAPGSVPEFLRQRRRWFGGFLQTQWWYRAMVGDRRLGTLGTVMLPVKAFDTVQPLYGLTAFALLIYFLVSGRSDILGPILLIVGGKIAIDVVFQIWSLRRYRRWVNDPARGSAVATAAATLVGPLSFQLLLQAGAALGWIAFLGGAQQWGSAHRFGMAADDR